MATKSKSKPKADTTPEASAPITAPPPQIDADVAELDSKPRKGEVGPLVLPGYWVLLGAGEGVEDRFVGHAAEVVSSPWSAAPIGAGDQPIRGYVFDESKSFIVRTRDDANSLLGVTEDEFTRVSETRVGLGR